MGLKLSNHIFLLTIFSFIPISNFAQLYGDAGIGVINDKDGYTFIREGKGTDSKILDTLWEGEFFQYTSSDTINWFKVSKMWNSSGFVHKSRIKDIKSFSRIEQRNLIDSIFKQEVLCYQKKCEYQSKTKFDFANYHEEKFTPILDLFIHYMKQEYDSVLFNDFLQIIILEDGSADELPAWTLGEIFLTYPQKVVIEVKKYESLILHSSLLFGFDNVTYDLNKGDFDFKKYKKILDQLNQE